MIFDNHILAGLWHLPSITLDPQLSRLNSRGWKRENSQDPEQKAILVPDRQAAAP
jgi:hypothetical protein